MKIFGDTNSGNCLKVKWVCDRLGLPYTWGRRRHAQARDPHHAISQAQQCGPGPDDRIRRWPHAGGIQRLIRYLAREAIALLAEIGYRGRRIDHRSWAAESLFPRSCRGDRRDPRTSRSAWHAVSGRDRGAVSARSAPEARADSNDGPTRPSGARRVSSTTTPSTSRGGIGERLCLVFGPARCASRSTTMWRSPG